LVSVASSLTTFDEFGHQFQFWIMMRCLCSFLQGLYSVNLEATVLCSEIKQQHLFLWSVCRCERWTWYTV